MKSKCYEDLCNESLTRILSKKYLLVMIKFTPFVILGTLLIDSFIDMDFTYYKLSIILSIINKIFVIFNLFVLAFLFKFCIYHKLLLYCIITYYIIHMLSLCTKLDLTLVYFIYFMVSIICMIAAIIHYLTFKRTHES